MRSRVSCTDRTVNLVLVGNKNIMSSSDLDERVSRLESERLINVQLATQSDIGFLAGTLGDTRKDIAAVTTPDADA